MVLRTKFKGNKISAYRLFEDAHPDCLYSHSHFTQALRRLLTEDRLLAEYTDNKHHNVSVLISKDCILTFK